MSFRVQAHFALLRFVAKTDRLEDLHHPIEGEIKRALERIRRAERMGPEEYVDHVNETSGLLIEELLGLAFAAAQVFLTAVKTRFVALARAYHQEFGAELTLGGMAGFGGKSEKNGYSLFKYTGEPPTQASFTAIEAINAVANYWKHHEEWPRTLKPHGKWCKIVWNDKKANNIQKRTIEIARALGMSPSGGVWNLQEAVKKLGVRRDFDLTPVRRSLQAWAASLLKETEGQISAANKASSGRARNTCAADARR
jgi:hypothetical protein